MESRPDSRIVNLARQSVQLPANQNVLRAMVQIAVYDAVVAIQGGYQPFAASIPAPAGSDLRAAVATAAYFTTRAPVDVCSARALEGPPNDS